MANAAIKKHVDSFNGYTVQLNKKIDNEFDQDVHRPKKHHNRLHNIIIPKESITSSKKKQMEGYIELPLSRKYKKELDDVNVRPRIKIPEDIRDKKIIMVEIIPIGNSRMFKANFTYPAKEPLVWIRIRLWVLIMGVNNICNSCYNNKRLHMIVDEKFLKNQYSI